MIGMPNVSFGRDVFVCAEIRTGVGYWRTTAGNGSAVSALVKYLADRLLSGPKTWSNL